MGLDRPATAPVIRSMDANEAVAHAVTLALRVPLLHFCDGFRTSHEITKAATITAGNAPGLNSAGAAMVVSHAARAEKHGLVPMARLVSYGVGAVEPGFFGLGPVPAMRQALARAGWSVGDVDRVEINEALAAIALDCLREIGFAEDVVNVDGGAIAHGHPIGASGAVLATKLLHAMQRGEARRAIVTLCIGGDQGIALAFERL